MKFYKLVDLSKIKVLSFDLDNTLYDCQSVIDAAEIWFSQYLCKEFGLGGQYQSYEFWKRVKDECLVDDPKLVDDVTMLRAVSLVKAFEYLKMPLQGGITEALKLVDIFIHKRSQGKVSKEVFDLLDKLYQKYPLISVSNGNLDTNEINITSYFKYDIRPNMHSLRRKPFEDMFKEACQKMKVQPDEVLHIGDDPLTDVYGAVQARCKCVWLRGGYTKVCPTESHLTSLPDIEIDNILELEDLLLKP